VVGLVAVAVAMQIDWPARQPSPKKSRGPRGRHNGLFAAPIDHGKPDAAFLNVHDVLRGIALREDDFSCSKPINLSPETG